MPRLLILFSLVNLVVGTGAFVISGILEPIGRDLGVSIPAAGQAMTAYAVATAVLAPLVMALTGGWPRKRALLAAVGVLTAGNLVCALAPNLAVLLLGRVLMGVGAVFTPLAAGIAVAMVEPARRGRALSLVFLGVSLSYAIGVPLGAWLGLAHGWHVPVMAVAVACAAAAAALAVLVPPDVRSPGASLAGVMPALRDARIRWTLLLTLLYFTAIFAVFGYAGPVLTALVPMDGAQLSITLALFGVSGVAGTLTGGWANDRFGSERTLKVQLLILGTMMLLVPLTRNNYPLLLTVFVIWGVAGFGMMAPQQSRIAALAPANAPLLLSLNTSMLYVGTAGGAAVGGVALGQGLPFTHLAWVGAPFAALGLLSLWFSTRPAAAGRDPGAQAAPR